MESKITQLNGFEPMYSKIIPNYFLSSWISNDGKWVIGAALKGGGYNVAPLSDDPEHPYWKCTTKEFDNIPTIEEAYKVYKKYSHL